MAPREANQLCCSLHTVGEESTRRGPPRQGGTQRRPGTLGHNVRHGHGEAGHLSRHGKCDRHGGIHVRTRHVSNGVNQNGNDKAIEQRNGCNKGIGRIEGGIRI
jgi:hypothetical protein